MTTAIHQRIPEALSSIQGTKPNHQEVQLELSLELSLIFAQAAREMPFPHSPTPALLLLRHRKKEEFQQVQARVSSTMGGLGLFPQCPREASSTP